MEKNKSKKSEGVSLVALIIIVILIIALAMSITYILKTSKQEITVNSSNSEQTINALKSEIDNLKNTIAQKENEIKNNENKKPVVQTNEMTSDEKYKIFAQNLKKEVSKYGNIDNRKTIYYGADAIKNSWYEVKLNSNGNLSLHFFEDEKLEKKYGTNSLVKNVLVFYIVDVGQTESHMIYFINEDGTVGFVNLDTIIQNSTGKIEIKNKISGLENIVSIINGATGLEHSGGYSPLFIDIDGNILLNN